LAGTGKALCGARPNRVNLRLRWAITPGHALQTYAERCYRR
jgi:hypothetical protein